jgi:hypothetical protein
MSSFSHKLSQEEIAELINSGAIKVPLDKPSSIQDRQTIHIAAHHERIAAPATVHEIITSTSLKSQGQALQRAYTMDSDSTLDPVWVETPGLYIIENRSGLNQDLRPDKHEQAELDNRLLLVKIVAQKFKGKIAWENAIVVRPKLFAAFECGEGAKVVVNPVNEPVDVVYTIFPR